MFQQVVSQEGDTEEGRVVRKVMSLSELEDGIEVLSLEELLPAPDRGALGSYER